MWKTSQLPTHTDNVALPAYARHMRLLLSAGRAAMDCSSGFAAVGSWWDRQTDGHRTVI